MTEPIKVVARLSQVNMHGGGASEAVFWNPGRVEIDQQFTVRVPRGEATATLCEYIGQDFEITIAPSVWSKRT